MATLTLRDKHTLRRMMAWACEHAQNTVDGHIAAAEECERFERVCAKLVPKGPLRPLPLRRERRQS